MSTVHPSRDPLLAQGCRCIVSCCMADCACGRAGLHHLGVPTQTHGLLLLRTSQCRWRCASRKQLRGMLNTACTSSGLGNGTNVAGTCTQPQGHRL